MIHVVAAITVRPGRRDAFLQEFRQLVPLVQAEQGCLEYGAAIDRSTKLAAQLPVRENVVVVIEKWQDLPALEAHLNAPHMLTYRQRVHDMVEKTELQILNPA